ncbi:unnamed protein product [Pseudo-nitzschia multistriata]|uniref:Uncharacterized protein n=1 Tax=Pseudo-nitzschia multistriata TaxID=183589 RepID=A0A448Z3V1_9STRA|nr:unnamed protein product [Pseudo-nitzschia multistriata]
MKFTLSILCLVVAYVFSAEATSLRGKSIPRKETLMQAFLSAAQSGDRRLDQYNYNQYATDDNQNQGDDQVDDSYGDDYVFYDDYALQNCEEGDEDCETVAKYTAYDDTYLANCEEADEDCNNAAAYMTAKKAKEEEELNSNEWSLSNLTDKYNSMSRSSKTWTIVLAVWFTALLVTTSYFCCCRQSLSQREKSRGRRLRESFLGGNRRGDSDGAKTSDERKRGRSKFKFFGRKGNKSKRGNSRGPVY